MVATGGKILATDYNSMRTNVTGILVALWGQSATSSNVSATVDSVTEDQLFDLYIDIQKVSVHQTGALDATIAAVSAGNTIGADTSFNFNTSTGTKTAITDGTLMGFNDYINAVTTIQNFDDEVTGYPPPNFDISSPETSQRTTQWGGASEVQSVYHVMTVTWTNASQRAFFFNAGGSIKFDASLTGSSGAKGTDWASMLSAMATIDFDKYATTASSGTPALNSGFDDLTSNYQIIFTKTGSGVYADNDYTISARLDGTTAVRFRIEFNDGDVGEGGQGIGGVNDPIDETVTGTLTSNVRTSTPNSSFTVNAVNYTACSLTAPTMSTSTNISQDLSTPPT